MPYPVANRMRAVQSSAIRDLLKYAQQPGMISLAGGLPSPATFDVTGIRQATERVFNNNAVTALQYGTTEGLPALREQLAALMAQRGVTVDAERILVTTGSQQGIDLMARVFVDVGDTVVVERPAYLAALQTFALAEARFATIDSDADGARVDDLEDIITQVQPKLIYIVANFANPSGNTLVFERRKRLLELAVKYKVFVLEDDPYGELRSRGDPVPPLVAIAEQVPGAKEWCGYLSTLSKILSPGFRIGWMVLPPALHNYAAIVKQGLDLHTSTFTQSVAATYLASGRLRERMPSICAAYRERNEALATALDKHLKGAIRYNRPDGGMFLWAEMTEPIDTQAVLQHAIGEGMIFVPGETFYAAAPERNTLRLSFATPSPDQLDEAVQRLARAIDKVRRKAA